MKRALIVLTVMVMAAPAFAQAPDSSPAGIVASQPADARPARFTISPAALGEAAGGQTLQQQEWQRQYDAAKARSKSGQTKFLIGLGMGLGGMIMMGAASHDCDVSGRCHDNETLGVTGGVLFLASGVPFWWGIVDWAGGSGAVHALEATRPVAAASKTITLTDHQALGVSVGPRTSVGYRLTW